MGEIRQQSAPRQLRRPRVAPEIVIGPSSRRRNHMVKRHSWATFVATVLVAVACTSAPAATPTAAPHTVAPPAATPTAVAATGTPLAPTPVPPTATPALATPTAIAATQAPPPPAVPTVPTGYTELDQA